MIEWNDEAKLIISDVDETIADLYVAASPEMINELEEILAESRVLFLISGQSVGSIRWRIVDRIKKDLRKRILIGHCSGAEVWGFNENGDILDSPYYSHYENTLSDFQKKRWRKVVQKLLEEFHLTVYPTMPVADFKRKSQQDPLSIMLEDRGPQITFEVVNGYNLSSAELKKVEKLVPQIHGYSDLRLPIMERVETMFSENDLPITPRLAGVFAIDFAVAGVSKTTAVQYILKNDSILQSLGLNSINIESPESIEVWGDKFSTIRGGTDRHMSEALPKEVRSITFRQEKPDEFPEGYNIVVWDGKKHLHEGLLEFLKSRNYT